MNSSEQSTSNWFSSRFPSDFSMSDQRGSSLMFLGYRDFSACEKLKSLNAEMQCAEFINLVKSGVRIEIVQLALKFADKINFSVIPEIIFTRPLCPKICKLIYDNLCKNGLEPPEEIKCLFEKNSMPGDFHHLVPFTSLGGHNFLDCLLRLDPREFYWHMVTLSLDGCNSRLEFAANWMIILSPIANKVIYPKGVLNDSFDFAVEHGLTEAYLMIIKADANASVSSPGLIVSPDKIPSAAKRFNSLFSQAIDHGLLSIVQHLFAVTETSVTKEHLESAERLTDTLVDKPQIVDFLRGKMVLQNEEMQCKIELSY
jgi:hypothetical protein